MNIKKMLEAQKELDKANMEKGGLAEYPLEMVQTAYRVELGELLQEWKQFKYWKLNKGGINRDKMLEEWADCMHFALSLQIQKRISELGMERIDRIYERIEDGICINDEYRKDLYSEIYEIIEKCFKLNFVLGDTILLGMALGFTRLELEQAYWRKNKINWERIEGGY